MDLSVAAERGASKNDGVPSTSGIRATPLDAGVFLACAIGATLLARFVAPNLPGATSGIAALIDAAEGASALTTQFTTLLGIALCVGLGATVAQSGGLSPAFRGVVAIATSGLVIIVVLAALLGPGTRGLNVSLRMSMALLSGSLALAAASASLRFASTRATGLVLTCITFSSTALVFSHYVAVNASAEADASMFATARAVATLPPVLDAVAYGLVGIWLWRTERIVAVATAALGTLAIGGVLWMAPAAAHENATTLQILCGRALSSIAEHPTPYLLGPLRELNELVALAAAGGLLFVHAPRRAVAFTFTAGLLCRSRLDVPFDALVLGVGSLLALATLPVSAKSDAAKGTPEKSTAARGTAARGTAARGTAARGTAAESDA